MRVVVALFLWVCFVVFNGHGQVNTSHVQPVFSSGVNKVRQHLFVETDRHLPTVTKADAFLSIEEDDDTPVFNRKYVLVTRYLTLLINATTFPELCDAFKNRLQFYAYLSHTTLSKYILQRVLRI